MTNVQKFLLAHPDIIKEASKVPSIQTGALRQAEKAIRNVRVSQHKIVAQANKQLAKENATLKDSQGGVEAAAQQAQMEMAIEEKRLEHEHQLSIKKMQQDAALDQQKAKMDAVLAQQKAVQDADNQRRISEIQAEQAEREAQAEAQAMAQANGQAGPMPPASQAAYPGMPGTLPPEEQQKQR